MRDIVLFESPTEASSAAPLTPEILAQIQNTVSDPLATLPPATRLGQMPRAYYTGKVARAERVKAFFLDVRDGWNMTVLQSAEAAGFTLVPPEPGSDVGLYLWLFVPETQESLVRATWGSIFQNLGEWLAG